MNKRIFWETLANSGLLSADNLVMAGDLNITLSAEEMWGSSNFSVSLADQLKSIFKSKNLVDIRPDRMVPTWRNGRQGSQAISKRLDRCIIAESLIISRDYYRSWVEFPFISDHAPIVFQMDNVPTIKIYPFKFNPTWAMDDEFKCLVFSVWKDNKYLSEEGMQRRLVWKLRDLKQQTKVWKKKEIC
jgi:hypothetical protein